MSRINKIGLLLLLAVFGLVAVRMMQRSWANESAGSDAAVVVRFAHVTIHPGIIRAYDDAIHEYEKLHPGVRIEQVPVPIRIWAAWLRTQMVGGSGPDLADMDRGQSDEFLARFFTPLDRWLQQPNPYNEGTDLADQPWRSTFVDGLTNPPGYRPGLQQVFGIPLTVSTIRVFANADLLRAITRSEQVPRDYAEFVRLCAQVEAYSARTGEPMVALAGSGSHMLPLLDQMFASQTQRLSLELNPQYTLAFTGRQAAIAYLRDEWNWRSPAIADGLALMREVGLTSADGFVQLQRDDSLFHFGQGRALMLVTGSWEADTIMADAKFRKIVFQIPTPAAGDDRYGRNVLGPGSELAINPGNAVGVSRHSPHREIAVDFLRFMSSQKISAKVMEASNRMSSTLGVAPPPRIAAFAPIIEGFPNGFTAEFSGVSAYGLGEGGRIYRAFLHELVSAKGSVEAFTRTMEGIFAPAITSDLRSVVRESTRHSMLEDAVFAAALLAPTDAEIEIAREARMREAQSVRELETAQIHHTLRAGGSN